MNSVVRRRQMRKLEIEKMRDEFKKNLPALSDRQIRRHRIKYEEALLLELEEDGFSESANYLRSLMEYQEVMREEAGDESYMWRKPLLRTKRGLLRKLYAGLKSTEMALIANEKDHEIDHLLALALYFIRDNDDNWWWLAEQLLLQSLELASKYGGDGNHRHALIRYFYGRFLLKNLKQIGDAVFHLNMCREISIGRNWLVGDFLHTEVSKKRLFVDCCYLLCRALLIDVKRFMEDFPQYAARICSIALKRAIEAECHPSQAECVYHIGLCEMGSKNFEESIPHFHKVLIMYFSMNDQLGICQTRLNIAAAHAKLRHTRDAKYHLTQLIEYTERNEMRFYEAHAHRALGEIYLHNYWPADALPHLLKALETFHELDDYINRELTKNLAAIAAGFQMMLSFRDLVQDCDTEDGEHYVMKMVNWKDSRQPFADGSSLSGQSSLYSFYSYFDDMYGEWREDEEESLNSMNYTDYMPPDNTEAAGTRSSFSLFSNSYTNFD